jgi:hypothetical protein
MESYGHGHLPRGTRRFAGARHYSDSKPIKLADFPSTPERDGDPELVALHSEFKIQRERLAAWGQEWGDDRVATGETELDATFERAELKDAVQDVLENVKKVLDESEQISLGVVTTPKSVGGGDKKASFWSGGAGVAEQKWTSRDRVRYEELATELKDSIDLLYDISKSRREIKESAYPGFAAAGKSKSDSALPPPVSGNYYSTRSYSTSEETLVNTTRSSTGRTAGSLELPARLDPSVLDIPAEEPPPYDSAGATPITRMIGHYRLPAPPSQMEGVEGSSLLMPVLIEYAPFDASYRTTGVPVPTNRLDSLMSFYARCGSLSDYSQFSTLSCLGYFEDTKEARFGLVYELPKKALDIEKMNGTSIDSRPVSLQKVLQQASKSLNSNNRLLPPGPPLEDRFRLAFNLVQAFSKMHIEEKLLHKDVNSSNIIFFLKPNSPDSKGHEYDLRAPSVASFDLFSEFSIEEPPTTPGRNLYRHPHDPKIFSQKCEFCDKSSCQCARYRFDIYGLGLVLLEIGLWCPLSDIFKQKYTLDDFRKRLETVWVRKLATRCGSIYQSVVKECLQQASQNVTEEQMRANYARWLKKLKRCCLLDEDEEEATPTTTPTRQTSISGAPIGVSPESSLVAAEGSNNPFLSLHAAPATSSFFSNPFARFTKKTPVPFSIKEEDNNPFHKQHDDAATIASRGLESTVFGSELDVTSTISDAPRYSRAASTIQKAWRSHRNKIAFTEYKRKIIVIQKAWRRRQQRSDNSSQITQADDIRIETEVVTDYTHIQITHHEAPPKPKLRLHTVKLTAEALDFWHDEMLPRLERICERCLRDSPETVSIDLIGVGETALSAKPTIFITCSSTGRLRGAINRKFHYDHDMYDLRVRRGRVRRSKVNQPKRHAPAHRSMMNGDYSPSDATPLNPFHQERPLCGASIGAYVGNKHLPPVSYGGVVHVDGEPYGMTVHHLLDAPSDEDDSEYDEQEADGGAERSSARRTDAYDPLLAGMAGHPTLQSIPTDSMFPLEISDDDEPLSSDEEGEEDAGLSDEEYVSDSDFESEPESIETEATRGTLGDLTGIHPGRGTDIFVTQPALDDVDEDFFPNESDRDDDHIDSHKLGCVHASSGIRRWTRPGQDGRAIVHEIDWALLKLDEGRLQPYNLVQGGRKHLHNPSAHDIRTPQLTAKLIEPICRSPSYTPTDDEFPVRVARSEELGNLRVHCFGRTSGLQGGIVGPAMSSVRIYRRRSFSRSWHVVGNFGVGGDSGAWVIDNEQGRVCGHVLAWCERNAIAYICPMEVLLEDIKRTLGARHICLPGGEDEVLVDSTNAPRQRLLQGEKKEVELPDIARLDFGDRERLGLGGGTAEEIMKRSAAGAVLRGLTGERINGSSQPAKGPRMEAVGVIGVS